MPREVVTVQLGNLANYVGAHYWNIEDELSVFADDETSRAAAGLEIDPHVSFMRLASGRYVPRAVMVDFQGTLGSMSEQGTMHVEPVQAAAGSAAWDGRVQRVEQEREEKNEFLRELEEEDLRLGAKRGGAGEEAAASSAEQRGRGQRAKPPSLDRRVRFWTDFLKTHLSERNIALMPGCHHEVTQFDQFGHGRQLWKSSAAVRDAVEDRVRRMAEASDALQGFQLLFESDSGWGGFAENVAALMRDDYGGAVPIFSVPLRRPRPNRGDALAQLKYASNALLTSCALWESSSLLLPLHCGAWCQQPLFPFLGFRPSELFHTTAVLGAALHTASAAFRTSDHRASMTEFARAVVPSTRVKALALAFALPLGADLERAMDAFAPASQAASSPSKAAASGARGAQRDADAAAAAARGESSKALHSYASMVDLGEVVVPKDAGQVIAEWCTLRGGALAHTPALTAYVQSLPRENALPMAERCFAPFLLLASRAHAFSRQATLLADPLPVPVPFPHFFLARRYARRAEPAGEVDEAEEDERPSELARVPVAASVYSSAAMATYWSAKHRELGVCIGNASIRTQWDKVDLKDDELQEMRHLLAECAEEYRK